jgi:16S rRNA (cytidine1402-2'-O)-methyltransferase
MPTPGTLYLLPTPLGDANNPAHYNALPPVVGPHVLMLHHFVAEGEKTARRVLLHYWKAALSKAEIDARWQRTTITVLNEHTPTTELPTLLKPLLEGHNVGLMSEAGLPAVADPGAELILLAHRSNITVVPLPGPSSLLLALAASGLGGQRFAFSGYLPRDAAPRKQALQKLEKRSAELGETQLFIEAPYRNLQLLRAVLQACKPATLLCVAADLTLPTEWVRTQTVAQWAAAPPPALDKRPAVFVLCA